MNNVVEITGNVGKDPVIRQTQTGKNVATFSVACKRAGQDPNKPLTDWINVVAWDPWATAVQQAIRKGSYIFVRGRYQTRSYDDKQGDKKYITEVVATLIAMVLKTNQQTGQQAGANQPFNAQQFGQPTHQYQQGNMFQSRDEDIPF